VSPISTFTRLRPVGVESFQTDGQDEVIKRH